MAGERHGMWELAFSVAIRVDIGGGAPRRPVRFLLPYIHSDTNSSSSTNHPLKTKSLCSSGTSYSIYSATFWKTRNVNFSAVGVAAVVVKVLVQNLNLPRVTVCA
jgi:hypothetical protein